MITFVPVVFKACVCDIKNACQLHFTFAATPKEEIKQTKSSSTPIPHIL